MIDCPNCGTSNPASSNFCSNCGSRLERPAPPADAASPTVEGSASSGPSTGERPIPAGPAPVPTFERTEMSSDRQVPVDDPPHSTVTSPPSSAPVSSSPLPSRPSIPPPVTLPPRERNQLPVSDPDWRMSDPGPLPERRSRRRWLWVALAILGFCGLVCVGVSFWTTTDAGQSFFAEMERVATETQRTQEAGE